jgi:hypothetical protein
VQQYYLPGTERPDSISGETESSAIPAVARSRTALQGRVFVAAFITTAVHAAQVAEHAATPTRQNPVAPKCAPFWGSIVKKISLTFVLLSSFLLAPIRASLAQSPDSRIKLPEGTVLGLARSVYLNLLRKGPKAEFPANPRLDIRLTPEPASP